MTKILIFESGSHPTGDEIKQAKDEMYTEYMSALNNANHKKLNFDNFIRDPKTVWYGPHECPVCGSKIVKSSIESGGVMLDAPHDSQYPNHQWNAHVCQ